ncbi:MAG: RHS repeat domain-containing protein [Terriglobales bacterium]
MLRIARYLLLTVISLAGSTLLAQSNPTLEKGLKPYGSFSGSDIDSVSLVNGKLELQIPLAGYSQRGGSLGLTFSVRYNNPVFTGYEDDCDIIQPCHEFWDFDNVGARLEANLGPRVDTYTEYIGSSFVKRYEVVTVDGSSHKMGQVGSTWETLDGTAIQFNPTTRVVIFPNGTRYYLDTNLWSLIKVEDANGNRISSTLVGGGVTGWTDTLGRTIPHPDAGPIITDYSGCTGPRPTTSARLWSLPAPGGTMSFKLCYAIVRVKSDMGSDGYSHQLYLHDVDRTTVMLQSIVLPNGTAWTFEYGSTAESDPNYVNFGDVTRIVFPTGGSISYGWDLYVVDMPGSGERWTQIRAVQTRTLDANDGSGPHTWSYSYGVKANPPALSPTKTTVTDPLGNQTVHTMTAFGTGSFYETQTLSYQGSAATGTLLKTTTTDYISNTCPFQDCLLVRVGVLPIRTTTAWPNGLTSKVEKDYDAGFTYTWNSQNYTAKYGLVVQQREYDYGSGVAGPLVRRADTAYLALSNANYKTHNLMNLVSSVTIRDGAAVQKALTNFAYDGAALVASGITTQRNTAPPNGTYRGNQTSVSRWLNTNGTYQTSTTAYFDTGMVYQVKDPLLHTTTFAYSATFAGAFPTQITNHLGHVTTSDYDFNTGLVKSATDPNNQTTTTSYDMLWRPVQVNSPDGGQSTITYNDTASPVTVTATDKITASLNLVNTAVLDGFGRVKQTRLDSDPEGVTYADVTYDELGRKKTETNPYRSTSDPTYGITTYEYDALGRVTKLIPPDGTASANNVVTVYDANLTTVTDQAGKKRKSDVDGLGRLLRVWEPDPNVAGSLTNKTRYFYDTLGNLTCVLQLAADAEPASCTAPNTTWRPRTFTYNSLSQLLTAANPESGTVTWTYDTDGSVLTKVSPKPNQTGALTVTVTYAYDALHRLTGKTYSNGDPAVSYFYDQTSYNGLTISNGKGRRTGMSDASGQTAWTYDSEGQVLSERRTISGVTKTISSTYNLDGSTATITYPSGRIITYTPSAAGRTLSAVDAASNLNYATAALYAPQGALASVKNGVATGFAGITVSNSYSKRLQPLLLQASAPSQTLLSLGYDFNWGTPAAPVNNGTLKQIANNRDTSRTQSFTYDELNRVKTAQSQATSGANCWGNSFAYDIWANLLSKTVTKCTAETLSVAVNTKNQLSSAGFAYDAAGNLTANGAAAYVYDAENRITTVAGVTYTYDGDGERVKKSNGKLYWAGNDPLAESDLSGNLTAEYIFFGGRRIARLDLPSVAVHYYYADHLGSSNVVANATGTAIEDESDFYPFGGERVITNSDPNAYKFTGKERDTESGLDYFFARYYASSLGRFMTPDWSATPVPVPYASLMVPQSLNLYAYVENNPITSTDPDGHFRTVPPPAEGKDQCSGVTSDPSCAKKAEAEQQQVQASLQFLKEELKGLWDVTGGAALDFTAGQISGENVANVSETAKLAITNPGAIGEALKERGGSRSLRSSRRLRPETHEPLARLSELSLHWQLLERRGRRRVCKLLLLKYRGRFPRAEVLCAQQRQSRG